MAVSSLPGTFCGSSLKEPHCLSSAHFSLWSKPQICTPNLCGAFPGRSTQPLAPSLPPAGLELQRTPSPFRLRESPVLPDPRLFSVDDTTAFSTEKTEALGRNVPQPHLQASYPPASGTFSSALPVSLWAGWLCVAPGSPSLSPGSHSARGDVPLTHSQSHHPATF